MRIPIPYDPKVNPSSRGLAPVQVQANPNAFGANIGQSLVGLGGAITTMEAEAAERERKQKDFDLLRRYNQFESGTQEDYLNSQRGMAPSGAGFADTVSEGFKKRSDEFLATVPADKQEEYKTRVDALGQRYRLQSLQHQMKTSDTYEDQGLTDELSRSKVSVNNDPAKLADEQVRLLDALSRTGLPPQVQQAWRRKIETELASVEYKALAKAGVLSNVNQPVAGGVDIVVDQILGVESSNRVDARNPRSSALGLGQFTNATWVEVLRRERPDLTMGQPDEALYALRLDPKLSRDMTRAYATMNAENLRQAGFAPSPGNIYLAHFLGPEGAKRVLAANENAPIQTVVTSDAYKSNKEVFAQAKTAGELKAWAVEKMGGVQALPPVQNLRFADGYWQADGVEYDLVGKIRALPVSKEYVEKVVPTIKALDPTLSIKITSGGQEPGKGTGSHRHDVNPNGTSDTSDFVLMRGGKPIRPADDPKLYAKVLESLAAQGFTGIGHYEWGVHVGGGSRAVWGPDKTAASASPEFRQAVQRGWSRLGDSKTDALDTSLTYQNIPFEDRLSLRQDAKAESDAQLTQERKRREAERQATINTLMNNIMDGTAGQTDIDRLVQRGVLGDYDERKKAQDALDRIQGEVRSLRDAQMKLQTPGAVWDPSSKEDRDKLNMLIGKEGLQALVSGSQDYVGQALVPLVRRTNDIPTEAVGTLSAMIRSNSMQQSLFALDTLAQLQQADYRAFDQRVSAETARDVDFWNLRKGQLPPEQIYKEIVGGNTQEERQAKKVLRADAQTVLETKVNGELQSTNLLKAVIDDYDGWLSSRPSVVTLPWAAQAMQRQINTRFIDAYTRVGNYDDAVKLVLEDVRRSWGTTEIGGSKMLMELPPEKAGYRPIDGKYDWIGKQVRTELKMKEGETFELFSDDQTRQEYLRFQSTPGAPPPSYRFIIKDAAGVQREKLLPDGKPVRMNFQPDQEDMQRRVDEKQWQSDKAADEEFLKEYERAKVYSRVTGIPVPQRMEEEAAAKAAARPGLEARKPLPPPVTGAGPFDLGPLGPRLVEPEVPRI